MRSLKRSHKILAILTLLLFMLLTSFSKTKIGGAVARNISHETGISIPFVVSGSDEKRNNGLEIPVMFSTDRGMTQSDHGPVFGDRRDEATEPHFGLSMVTIPSDIQSGGAGDFSFWKLTKTTVDGDSPLLSPPSILDRTSWRRTLQSQIDSNGKKSALIFVHGYNNDFNGALQRAAQISYYLKFDGPTILYSWPSAAKALGYEADTATAESSAPRLAQMLLEIFSRTSVERVYIIGHSMGTHILCDALIRAAAQYPMLKNKLKEMILAAPDIDAQYFREQIGPEVANISKHVTLYCSKNDAALSFSYSVHVGYARAGDCENKVTLVDKIDTIDASEADTSLMGHAYVADSNNIINDMYAMIKSNVPAKDRISLSSAEQDGKKYWIYRVMKH